MHLKACFGSCPRYDGARAFLMESPAAFEQKGVGFYD
jgi:hypothetical protein